MTSNYNKTIKLKKLKKLLKFLGVYTLNIFFILSLTTSYYHSIFYSYFQLKRIFERRLSLLHKFAQKLNQSIKANICFWHLIRAYGAICNYFGALNIWIGYIIAVIAVKPQTVGLYGISIVFLDQSGELLLMNTRQIVMLESMMVSVERALKLTELPSEKGLKSS